MQTKLEAQASFTQDTLSLRSQVACLVCCLLVLLRERARPEAVWHTAVLYAVVCYLKRNTVLLAALQVTGLEAQLAEARAQAEEHETNHLAVTQQLRDLQTRADAATDAVCAHQGTQ